MTDEQTLADEKLPCPFCGCEDVFQSSVGHNRYLDREYYAITCSGCGVTGKESLDPESPATFWNRRAPDKDAAIARLTEELRLMTTAGIVEVAVRNPQVAEYMRHWESRAEKAEAALAQARAAGFREGVEAAAKEWQNVRVEGGVAVAAVMAYSDRIRALAPQAVDVRDTPTQAQQAGLSDAKEPQADPVREAAQGRVKVPEGQTPLNDKLGHRLLDVLKEGEKARDDGTSSPYHGHSLEHCIHAVGWVQRDLRLALDDLAGEQP